MRSVFSPTRGLVMCAFFLLASLPARAQKASPLSRPSVKSDFAVELQADAKRLAQNAPVLLLPRVTLRDFVARLAQETGVSLTLIDLPKEAGDAELFVSVREKDRTIAQIMDALASLMSYQKAAWHWERLRGADSTYRYELRPSRALSGLAEEVGKQIQSDYEAQDTAMQAALKLKPEALDAAQKANPHIAHINSPIEELNRGSRSALQLFFSTLSQTERQQILRGKEQKVIPFDDLPEAGKKFVAAMRLRSPDGPAMTNVTIQTVSADPDSITPALVMGLSGPQGTVTAEFLGGRPTNKIWNDRLSHWWQDGKDTFDNPPVDLELLRPTPRVSSVPLPKAFKTLSPSDELPLFLHTTLENAPCSLLAVVNLPSQHFPGVKAVTSHEPVLFDSLSGKPLREVLRKLQTAPSYHLDHKWREGVLLMRDASAPFAPVPYALQD